MQDSLQLYFLKAMWVCSLSVNSSEILLFASRIWKTTLCDVTVGNDKLQVRPKLIDMLIKHDCERTAFPFSDVVTN